MKGLLLLLLLLLPACQTVSYHTDGDHYACKEEAAAAVAAHGGKVAWYVGPLSDEPNNDSGVFLRCLADKPMVTETRFGGYGGAVLAGEQHGTAFFYSPGGNSGTLYY